MAAGDPSVIVMQGAKVWNPWHKQHPIEARFNRPSWYRGHTKGMNDLDFSGMHFVKAEIFGAFAEGLNLRNAVFDGTVFEEGDFSRAYFCGATFRNTRFNKTTLTNAVFDGATFVNCNFNRVNLTGASFHVKEITETVVYGISAWDLQTSDGMKQSNLVIEKTYELYSDLIERGAVPMTVDDIELAQFVYYLSSHRRMRDTINILNTKGVLLLGRFKHGGLDRLYAMRKWLQQKGYSAMIFDFERPDNLDLIETVVTMAGLCKFVVADISGPSVAVELDAILDRMRKPILIIGELPATMPAMLAGKPVLVDSEGASDLVKSLASHLNSLEELHAARTAELIQLYPKHDESDDAN